MVIRGKVEVAGESVSYEVAGDGQPLLLIAGLGWGAWSWYRQIPSFSRRHRVIAVNNRGVENCTAGLPAFTLPMMAEDCRAILQQLGVERAHVLGFSMGGYIAQELAASHPERVDRLILQSTAFLGPSALPATPEACEFFSNYGKLSLQEHVERGAGLRFSEAFIRRYPGFVEEFAKLFEQHAPSEAGYRAQLQAISSFRNEERVRDIRSRTLILAGSADRVLPSENSRLLAANIPNSTLHIFEGAGHCVNVERADEFNRMVLRFLA